jgi:hypothetical protein
MTIYFYNKENSIQLLKLKIYTNILMNIKDIL